jgi:hypothetical protein
MADAEEQSDPRVLGTAKHLRRLVHLRESAPADHHRYLLHLIVLFMAKPQNADDLIQMYREEFDL